MVFLYLVFFSRLPQRLGVVVEALCASILAKPVVGAIIGLLSLELLRLLGFGALLHAGLR